MISASTSSLAEEQHLIRIFGVFPIALLGTQFLTPIYVTRLSLHVPFEWMGLAGLFVAMLLTAIAFHRPGFLPPRLVPRLRERPLSASSRRLEIVD